MGYLFLVACLVCAVLAMAANLLSPKPECAWTHVRRVGRLLVFAGAMCSAARFLESGWTPPIDIVVFVIGAAILLAVQVNVEVSRQRRTPAHGDRRRVA